MTLIEVARVSSGSFANESGEGDPRWPDMSDPSNTRSLRSIVETRNPAPNEQFVSIEKPKDPSLALLREMLLEDKEYRKNGTLKSETEFYRPGQKKSVTEYADDGKTPTRSTSFDKQGKVASCTEYTPTGNPEHTTLYGNGGVKAQVIDYGPDGVPTRATSYDEAGNVTQIEKPKYSPEGKLVSSEGG